MNFLWGWAHNNRKISWVKCDDICKTKDLGGSGVKNLKIFNLDLLSKLKWRLESEVNGLWKDIIQSKYGNMKILRERKRCRGGGGRVLRK